jgi:hypothetical protein
MSIEPTTANNLLLHPLSIAAGPTIFDVDVAVFHPTETLKTLPERRDAQLPLGVLRLLRPRREWPCGYRAAEQRDELAPL